MENSNNSENIHRKVVDIDNNDEFLDQYSKNTNAIEDLKIALGVLKGKEIKN